MTLALDTSALLGRYLSGPHHRVVVDAMAADRVWCASALALAEALGMVDRVCDLPSVQLQLCQPNDDPSPQRVHLDTKGEGVFHLGFEVPEANAAESVLGAAGLSVKMRGRRANGTGFNYYDTDERGGVLGRREDAVHELVVELEGYSLALVARVSEAVAVCHLGRGSITVRFESSNLLGAWRGIEAFPWRAAFSKSELVG